MMNGVVASLLLSVAVQAPADPTTAPRREYTLTPDGRWVPVESAPVAPTSPTTVAATDPQLDAIEAMLGRGQFDRARGAAVDWLKRNPRQAPGRDRALLLAARALQGDGQGIKAFYYCDELLDTYPESPLFAEALQLQYDVADSYLGGRRDRFAGLRIVGRDDEAIEMLFRIQQRSPGSPLADQALLRTANHYWESGDYELAADTYGFYAQRYPRSPQVPRVRLLEAYSNLRQFRGPLYDPAPLLNARTQLAEVRQQYPDLAEQENVAELADLAERQLARKLYLSADFYRRTGKPDAAAHLCRRLIAQYPETPEADDGRRLLARLGASETPPPPSRADDVPPPPEPSPTPATLPQPQ